MSNANNPPNRSAPTPAAVASTSASVPSATTTTPSSAVSASASAAATVVSTSPSNPCSSSSSIDINLMASLLMKAADIDPNDYDRLNQRLFNNGNISSSSSSSSSSSIVRNDRAELILIGVGIDIIEQDRWRNELFDKLFIEKKYQNDLNNFDEPYLLHSPFNIFPLINPYYDTTFLPPLPVYYRWNTELLNEQISRNSNEKALKIKFILNEKQLSLPDEAKEEKKISIDSPTIFSGSIMAMMKQQKDRTDIDNIRYWPWKSVFETLYGEGETFLQLLNNDDRSYQRYDIIITQLLNRHIISAIEKFFASRLGSLINDKKNKYEAAVNECKEKIAAYKVCLSNGEYIQAAIIQTDYLKLIDKDILPLNRELRAVIEGGLQEHAIQERLSNALASFSEAIKKQIEDDRHLSIITNAGDDSKTYRDATRLVDTEIIEHRIALDKEINRLSKDREIAVFNIQCDAVKPATEKAAKSKAIDYLISIDNEIKNRRCAHRLLKVTADRWKDAADLLEDKLKTVIYFHTNVIDIYDASLLFARRVIQNVNTAIKGLIDDLRSNMEHYEKEACENFSIFSVETNIKLWQWEHQMEEKNNEKSMIETRKELFVLVGNMKGADDAKNRSDILDIEMSELKTNINTLKADEESLMNTNNLLVPLYRKYSLILPDAAYKETIGKYSSAITLAQRDLAASLSNNRYAALGGGGGGGYMERNALPPAL